jgi:hypothetical protein
MRATLAARAQAAWPTWPRRRRWLTWCGRVNWILALVPEVPLGSLAKRAITQRRRAAAGAAVAPSARWPSRRLMMAASAQRV